MTTQIAVTRTLVPEDQRLAMTAEAIRNVVSDAH